MPTNITFNNTTYSIPQEGDRVWGANTSLFLIAVGQNALSKAGGTFTLTADTNFGATYGLIAKYFKSVSSNIATAGELRLANVDTIQWRNGANNGNLSLGISSDRLQFAGVNIPTISSTDTLTNKTIDGASNTITNISVSTVSGILPTANGGTGQNSSATFPSSGVVATVPAAGVVKSNGIVLSTSSVNLASEVTGTLPVANGGTGVTASTGSGSVVLSNNPTLVSPALGTPGSGTLTNCTGLPIVAGTTGTLSVARGGTGTTTSTGSGDVVLSVSPTLTNPNLGTPSAVTLTNATGLPIVAGTTGTLSVARGGTGVTASTGSGSVVLNNSPSLITPTLGTPASGTLTNCTGLPVATGITGLGSGVATLLATFSSANLRSALTDETGTGSAVFADSPTLTSPVIDNAITMNHEFTPSNPGINTVKIYPKNDNKLYILNSSGVEAEVGSGFANPMTTGGDLIYGGASGAPTRLANGSSGQVLTSNGGTSAPSWQTPAGGAPSVSTQTGNFTAANNTIYLVSSAAARNITLPAASSGIRFWVKDSTGSCETNNFTIVRAGSEQIDGIAANRTLQANWGSWMFVCDGTNWFIL